MALSNVTKEAPRPFLHLKLRCSFAISTFLKTLILAEKSGKEDKFCQNNIQNVPCITIITAEKLLTLTSVPLSGMTKTV
jgi:hypothetical protein